MQEEDEECVTAYLNSAPKVGESLMIRRKLIKVPTIKEPPQRKTLFRENVNLSERYVK